MVMTRSTVKRPSWAVRMRENSLALSPVTPSALRTGQFAVIEFADDRGGQDGFKVFYIGPVGRQVTEDIAAAFEKFHVYPSTIVLASWSVSIRVIGSTADA